MSRTQNRFAPNDLSQIPKTAFRLTKIYRRTGLTQDLHSYPGPYMYAVPPTSDL